MSTRNRNATASTPKAAVIILLIPIAFIIVTYLMFGHRSSDPSVTSHQSPASPTTDKTGFLSPYYALQSANYTWPPGQTGEISPDLMTRNYYLVFDGSGSMNSRSCGGQDKLAVAKASVLQFIDRLGADANIGLFVFDQQGARQRVALARGNRNQLRKAVQQVTAGGSTPLSTSIERGFTALTSQAKKQLGYGEYHLVIVTDGEASIGFDPSSSVENVLASSPVNIHTIGFCISEDHTLNQPGLTFYRAADDHEALTAGLNEVLAEAPDFSLLEFSN